MPTKEQIQAAKAANPTSDINSFVNVEYDVDWLVKAPDDVEYQAWRASQSAAGDDIMPANREFMVRQVVFPDPKKDPVVREKLAKYPGLVEAGVRALSKLAGARAEFTVKKL